VDPRVARSKASVLQVAAELLVEGGPNALTIDAVVARSGVARSTIYRHWGSRHELLVDVIESRTPQLPAPDDDADVVGELRRVLRASASGLSDPEWASIVPALMLLRNHQEDFEAIDSRMKRQQLDVFTSLVRRAADEGVIDAGVDADEATCHLLGPIMFAYLTAAVPIDDDFVDRVLDRFLAAHRGALAG
jgi:AcrR family transcriptional regulator